MSKLNGIIKFVYSDNRFEARKYLNKDLNKLFNMCYPLNEEGVSYAYDFEILNEPSEKYSSGRYCAEVQIRIEGSKLEPQEMKEEIDAALDGLETYDSSFIY